MGGLVRIDSVRFGIWELHVLCVLKFEAVEDQDEMTEQEDILVSKM